MSRVWTRELAVLESDVSDIRTVLNRLTPRIDEMYGFLTVRLPQSATNAELTGLLGRDQDPDR